MFARVFVVFICAAWPALASDWVRLSGDEVETILNDAQLKYEASEQKFYASGKTLYDNGRPSWGYWAVRGDQYCSQWPPADEWACYDLDRHRSDGRVRFVTESGAATEGVIVE